MKKYSWKFKNRPAQQMVEFLLVMPFVIILFGILTEYAYALTINLNLNQGLKLVTSSIYSQIHPDIDTNQVKDYTRYWLEKYLRSRNAPANLENELEVDYKIAGEDAVFIASYKYIPVFTLPNIYFHFLPNTMKFTAISIIPSSFLDKNIFDTTLTDVNLWGSPIPDTNKNGIMKYNGNALNAKTQSMLFLVPITVPLPTFSGHKTYEVKKWDGSGYSPPKITIADLTDKKLYSCTSDWSSCPIENNNFISEFITSPQPFTNIIFYNPNNAVVMDWLSSSLLPVYNSGVTGHLKSALALADLSNKSLGNYDNLVPAEYNDNDAWDIQNNLYSMKNFGIMTIVYNENQTNAELSNLLNGFTLPTYTSEPTHFNTEFGVLSNE